MFKIGQKIVCINPVESLKKDEIYTVSGFNRSVGVTLIEVNASLDYYGFLNERFIPIDLDLEFAENILSEIIEQVKEEELVHLN